MKTIIFSTTFLLALMISPVFAQKVSNYDHNANAGVNHAPVYIVHPTQSASVVKGNALVLPSVYENIPKPKYATYIPDLWFYFKIINPDECSNADKVAQTKNQVANTK